MKFTLNLNKAWERKVKRNEILAPYTYFRIGGPADYFVTVKSSEELKEIILSAESSSVPWFILGGGSNILVGDLGFRGLVIKNEAQDMRVSRRLSRWRKFVRSPSPARLPAGDSGWPQTAAVLLANLPTSTAISARNSPYGYLTAESGVKMAKLAAFANDNGLAGLEVFMSVPGTLGGAVFNNSHFRPEKGEFIGNLVETVEILEGRGKKEEGRREIKIVDRDWFRFGYDYSRLHDEPGVVLKVKFRLKKSDPEKLKSRSIELFKERNIHQPIGQSSCGCMFKNPSGFSAGELIDQAGMMGKKVGGAMVSDKHANFVINTGRAKATEVLELMDLIKTAVKTKSGIDLEPEIFIVGEF